MTYRVISHNIKTDAREVLAEVRGLEDVAETIKDIVFEDGDNVEEWSFEIVPVTE